MLFRKSALVQFDQLWFAVKGKYLIILQLAGPVVHVLLTDDLSRDILVGPFSADLVVILLQAPAQIPADLIKIQTGFVLADAHA